MTARTDYPIIQINNLTVAYHAQPVLKHINLTLPTGKIIGIIGPNGAGKSTLLKAIMGLVPINRGTIQIFGKKLNNVRRRVSYVPQKESVDWDFPASVFDIALLGRYNQLGLFQKPRSIDKDATMYCLEQVGMVHLADRQIGQLSGGQQQRVFLARALAQDALLYLMDEPFSGIDIATENKIIGLLKGMVQQGKTIIVVHHDLQSVVKYFDWLVLLNEHIVATGFTKQVFTDTFLQTTYSSKLSFLYS